MSVPYLCGGTFLKQLLRAQAAGSIDEKYVIKDHYVQISRKQNSNPIIFNALIAVYKLDHDFKDRKYIGDFRSPTSNFINCKQGFPKNAKYRHINVSGNSPETDILRKNFDDDVASKEPKSLDIINDVINNLLDVTVLPDVVYSLLEIIEEDTKISDDDKFFVSGNGQYVTKKELLEMTEIYAAPFLLGVWHFIIKNRFDKYREGEETITEWKKGSGVAKYPRGEKYRQSVKVLFERKKDHDIETDTKRIFERLEQHEKIISELYGNNDDLTRCLEIIGSITMSADAPDKGRCENCLQKIKPFLRKVKNYKLSNGIPKNLNMDKPLMDSLNYLTKEIKNGEFSEAFCILFEEIKQIYNSFYSGDDSKAKQAIKSAKKIYSSLFPGDIDFA